MSFDTMVLFGDHAADPHGEPGERTLKENEWVLFDLGTMVDGYAVTLLVRSSSATRPLKIHVIKKSTTLFKSA